MKKIANIYVRGCVGEVDMQLKECRLAAHRLGVDINRECVDMNKSGLSDNRQGYKQLVADIKNNNIQIIIVKDFDRFHRDTLELINFMKLVSLHKVKVYFTFKNDFFTEDLSDVKTLRVFAFNESKKWLK